MLIAANPAVNCVAQVTRPLCNTRKPHRMHTLTLTHVAYECASEWLTSWM